MAPIIILVTFFLGNAIAGPVQLAGDESNTGADRVIALRCDVSVGARTQVRPCAQFDPAALINVRNVCYFENGAWQFGDYKNKKGENNFVSKGTCDQGVDVINVPVGSGFTGPRILATTPPKGTSNHAATAMGSCNQSSPSQQSCSIFDMTSTTQLPMVCYLKDQHGVRTQAKPCVYGDGHKLPGFCDFIDVSKLKGIGGKFSGSWWVYYAKPLKGHPQICQGGIMFKNSIDDPAGTREGHATTAIGPASNPPQPIPDQTFNWDYSASANDDDQVVDKCNVTTASADFPPNAPPPADWIACKNECGKGEPCANPCFSSTVGFPGGPTTTVAPASVPSGGVPTFCRAATPDIKAYKKKNATHSYVHPKVGECARIIDPVTGIGVWKIFALNTKSPLLCNQIEVQKFVLMTTGTNQPGSSSSVDGSDFNADDSSDIGGDTGDGTGDVFLGPKGAGGSRLKVKTNGDTAISGALAVSGALTVTGAISGNTVTTPSDIRLKKDIVPIDRALEKVLAIDGVYFKFRSDEFQQMHLPEGQQMGLIAQNVEKVAPEVVQTGSDGIKRVSYQNLVGLLMESIKELNRKIDNVEAENEALKALLSQMQGNELNACEMPKQ